MQKLLALMLAVVGGWVGWWLGAKLGMLGGLAFSLVGTAGGLYAANRITHHYLG